MSPTLHCVGSIFGSGGNEFDDEARWTTLLLLRRVTNGFDGVNELSCSSLNEICDNVSKLTSSASTIIL
jgi:hypothetical protein